MGFFVCDFLLGGCFVWYSLLAVGFLACFFSSYAHAVGFPRLLFYSHAQFSLRDISISFRGGLSRLLFFSYTHAVGFPAYFSTPTPSFRSATYQLASRLGFLACFSSSRVSPHRYRSVVYRRAHPKYVLRTYAPSYAHAVGFPTYFSTHTPKSIYSS